jgi:hypothetical protein
MVSIRRDPKSGEIILSELPDVDEIFAALDAAKIPADFLSDADRDRRPPEDRPALDGLFDGGTRSGGSDTDAPTDLQTDAQTDAPTDDRNTRDRV